MVQSKPYDYRIDVWALGCVLYHLTNLEPPFLGENLISLGYNIVNKSPKPLNSIYSIKLANFIMRLLEKNPGKRPKINELLIEFDPMNRRNIKEDKLEKKGKIEITNEKEYLILKRNILEEKSTKYRKFHEKYKKINKIPLEEPLSEIKDENIKKNSNNEKKIENFQNKQVFNNNFINSPEILKNKEKNTEKKQIQDPPLRQNFIQDTFLAQNLIQDLSLAQKPMQDPPSFVKDSGQEVSLAKDQIQYKSDPNFRKNMKPHVIFELKNAKNINNFGFFSKNIQNSRIRPMSANFKPKFKTAESFYPLIKQIKQQNLAEMPQNIESNYEKDKKIEETEKKEFDSKSSRPKSAMLPFSRQFRENIVNIPKLIEEVGDNFSNIEKESEEIKKYQENLNLLGLKRPKTAIFRGETKEKRKLTIYDLF